MYLRKLPNNLSSFRHNLYLFNFIYFLSAPEIPSICLNKDIFGSKLKVIRDGRTTKGISLNVFMQGTYQLDREVFDTEIMFNDSCQVKNQ